MSSSTGSPWIFNHPEPSGNNSQATIPTLHLNLPLFRFAGDGLDCRTPVMSAPPREVIDLTEEPSSPLHTQHRPQGSWVRPSSSTRPHGRHAHLTHEVISIDDMDDEPTGPEVNEQRSGSPDIELLYARPRFDTTRLPPPPRDAEGLSNTRRFERQGIIYDPNALADWRGRLARALHPQDHHAADGGPARTAHIHQMHEGSFAQHAGLSQPDFGLNEDLMFLPADPQINLPGHLDFMRPGFDMGNGPHPPPRTPTYDAPSPPQAGYTRSPKEEDVLVCPNCEEELGGGENDLKKQVWVARKCGHVCITAVQLQYLWLTECW